MIKVALARTGVVSVTVMTELLPTNVGSTVKKAAGVKRKNASTHPAIGPTGLPITAVPEMKQFPIIPKLLPVMITVAPRRAGLGINV